MAAPATAISGWSNDGKKGKALNFDGSDDYILSSPRIFSGDMTVSAWFKPRSFTSNWAGVGTFQYKSGTSGTGWQITPLATGVKVVVGRMGSNYITQTFSATLPINSWSHILAIHSNGVFRVYLNGKKIGSDWSQPVIYDAIGDKVHIGRWAWDYNGYYFDGLIDEPKVYSFALTEDEIKAEFNGGSIVAQGTPKPVSVGGPSTGAHARYCPPGNTEGNCAPGLDPSPVGEWTFDEGSGTTAKDTSGKGNNGTLTNGPVWVPGKIGRGLRFDGSNDYVSIGDNDIFNMPNISISTWIKTNRAIGATQARIVNHQESTVKAWGLQIFGDGYGGATGGDKIAFHSNNCVSAQNLLSLGSISSGSWYHVVAINDGSKLKIYINGKLDNSSDSLGNNCSSISAPVVIGKTAQESLFYFPGQIDDVRIYPYARTPAQIAWDYNQGAPIAHYRMDECQGTTINDASGNNNHGTWNGSLGGTQISAGTCQTANTAWGNGVNGKFESSLNFDGTDDYINQPTSLANVYSVSFFAKPTSTTQSFLQLASGTSISATNGTVSATGFTSPTITVNGKTNGTVLSGQWNHITVTTGTPITANAIKLGLVGSTYYSGQIDDVRIYNYALSTEQIKLLYNNASALRFGDSETVSELPFYFNWRYSSNCPGISVYYKDSGVAQWKTTQTDCDTPQCGIDGGQDNDNLVADNAIDFSLYPARNLCKSIGGRLPTLSELQCIYTNRALYDDYGAFVANNYWSSTEYSTTDAYYVGFYDGGTYYDTKMGSTYTRCVRGQ